MSKLTEQAFYNWLRSNQENKRLTQTMVDAAEEMIASMGIVEVQNALSKINKWPINDNGGVGMDFSVNGFNALAEFESFVSKPYKDIAGIWTIGYGNTYYPDGTSVKSTDTPLTLEQAVELKTEIVNRDFAGGVNIMLADEIEQGLINQNQFDAVVCLAYNIGVNALQGSSVIRNIKNGNLIAAADSFRPWNKAKVKGKRVVVKGLVNRREIERTLFLS